jgi:hypothetical protein
MRGGGERERSLRLLGGCGLGGAVLETLCSCDRSLRSTVL